ncbi:MAG: hydroxymethylbilane synthase [Candidatus Hydrogenedentes bacterium]|nr:hydroxymethylbilane synthase [Candidatus Hydrogenedentota bacterium]
MNTVVFGSRGSALALSQTKHIMARFEELNPSIKTDLSIVSTTGDQLTDLPLSAIGGQGAFTREIEHALLDAAIDVAVHSLKDLPIQQPQGLYLCAIPEREAPEDILITKNGCTLEELPQGARVGTSSLRRKIQLLLIRPDLEIVELRGNVPTRIARVVEGPLDAAILALAGIRRLRLENDTPMQIISLSQMLPSPGQGALALEIRTEDVELAGLITPLHDARAAAEVHCERAILKGFGGGCRAPLGTYAQCIGNTLDIRAIACNPDTGKKLCIHEEASVEEAQRQGEDIGLRLAKGLQLC